MSSDDIRRLLLEKGLKVTPQRVVITEYLVESESHPTADEVFAATCHRLPACSRATIYNTLNALQDAGIVNAVSTEPGITRYDANLKPHHHFVDVGTGVIYDIPTDAAPWPISEMGNPLPEQFQVNSYQITFYGHVQRSAFPDDSTASQPPPD